MKRLAILAVVIFIFSCGGKNSHSKDIVTLKKELKTGYIIFQTLPGELSQVICEITESPISHCGMIIRNENGDLSVIEAIGPVRIVPFDDFIKHGIKEKFAVIKLKDNNFKDFDKVVTEAKKFLGRPYDILYKFDDENIYCSELLFKAFYNAAKMEIARKVKLGDLNYKGSVDFIKSITGGEIPLEREMVTPVDVYNSKLFVKVFSNYTDQL